VTKQRPQAAQALPALFRSKSIATATNQQHAIPLALPFVAWHGRLGRAELESQVSLRSARYLHLRRDKMPFKLIR
jgi:hypothetical protein